MREIILLLKTKILSYKNSSKNEEKKRFIRFIIFFSVGLFFWLGTFLIFFRVLSYFSSIEVVGALLASRLLSMVFLTFFSLLIFSNVITALSTYFLSDDLQLLNSTPVALSSLYAAASRKPALRSRHRQSQGQCQKVSGQSQRHVSGYSQHHPIPVSQ